MGKWIPARLRRLAGRVVAELQGLAKLHIAAAIGLAAAVASELAHTDGVAKALIGFAVTVLVRQVGDLSGRRARRDCLKSAAMNVRIVLNRRLEVGYVDRYASGNFLVLRELAEAADDKALTKLMYPAVDAGPLAREVAEMRSGFLTELATCYPKVQGSTQGLVDAFTESLSAVVVSAFALSYQDPALPDETALLLELHKALRVCVAAGDALDRHADPDGAAAAAAARAADVAALRALRKASLEILVANARDALAPLADLDAGDGSLSKLRAAVDRTRHVEAAAFHDASEEARAAHRKITADLATSVELAQQLETEAIDARARDLGDAMALLAPDLEALEDQR
jgi:hypothetical protein